MEDISDIFKISAIKYSDNKNYIELSESLKKIYKLQDKFKIINITNARDVFNTIEDIQNVLLREDTQYNLQEESHLSKIFKNFPDFKNNFVLVPKVIDK